jgi:hypothetical protein
MMAMQFRNRADSRRYAAAEDAYTSEGGYLALEDETLGQDLAIEHEPRHPFRGFRKTIGRYAAEMGAALTTFRGGTPNRPGNRPAA